LNFPDVRILSTKLSLIKEPILLPKLEEMVLLAILKHGADTTAGEVQAALSEAAGKERAFGSIFTTLDRLTEKKMVKWRKGTPDARRGGRAPRLYTITGVGQTSLIASLRATQSLAHGIDLGTVAPAGARG
jgi:PadR family transcriptional regulator, regulatory protein PadR